MQHLGLPLSDKKLNRAAYLPLLKKFTGRLTGWAAKHLSIAGRLVLLNAVLSSIPVYYMSCFKLPSWVIEEIDKVRRNFLWHGVSQQPKKLSLVNWNLVCTPKKLGGLGVLDLTTFNHALLLKWFWKWESPHGNLIKPMMMHLGTTEEMLPNSMIFNSRTLSDFWFISIRRTTGNGCTAGFWIHDWGLGVLRRRFQHLYSYTLHRTVSLQQALLALGLEALFRNPLPTSAEAQLITIKEEVRAMQTMLTNEEDTV